MAFPEVWRNVNDLQVGDCFILQKRPMKLTQRTWKPDYFKCSTLPDYRVYVEWKGGQVKGYVLLIEETDLTSVNTRA